MKKCLVSIICALCAGAAFAAGENVATSKAFVDNAVAQKQDKISANNGATQVLTNTGESGTVGTKDIYSASGEYDDQMDSLVDAATMNAAIQNAIDAEFQCISWNDQGECLLVEIFSGPNIAHPAPFNATFDQTTGILTNTWAAPTTFLNINLWLYNTTSDSQPELIINAGTSVPRLYRTTFTTNASQHYLKIKHNDNPRDIGAWIPVEPLTQYTILVDVLEANPSVVGGLKMKIMLVRGEWDHDFLLAPGENIYMPNAN